MDAPRRYMLVIRISPLKHHPTPCNRRLNVQVKQRVWLHCKGIVRKHCEVAQFTNRNRALVVLFVGAVGRPGAKQLEGLFDGERFFGDIGAAAQRPASNRAGDVEEGCDAVGDGAGGIAAAGRSPAQASHSPYRPSIITITSIRCIAAG